MDHPINLKNLELILVAPFSEIEQNFHYDSQKIRMLKRGVNNNQSRCALESQLLQKHFCSKTIT